MRATSADISGIEEALLGMKSSSQDIEEFSAHDAAFHGRILSATKNEILRQATGAIVLAMRIRHRAALDAVPAPLARIGEHQAVLDAIRSGKPEEAYKSMASLLSTVRTDDQAIRTE